LRRTSFQERREADEVMEVVCWSAPTVAENLARDDSAARSVAVTGLRRLRFWWGGPPAVVMGSSERPEQVVDAEACARLGVDVLKRSTGGGQRAPDWRRAELFADHTRSRKPGSEGRFFVRASI